MVRGNVDVGVGAFPLEGLVTHMDQVLPVEQDPPGGAYQYGDSILIHALTMGRTWFKKWLILGLWKWGWSLIGPWGDTGGSGLPITKPIDFGGSCL